MAQHSPPPDGSAAHFGSPNRNREEATELCNWGRSAEEVRVVAYMTDRRDSLVLVSSKRNRERPEPEK